MRFTVYLACLVLVSGADGGWQCPEQCRCSLDVRGRREVVCAGGSMTGLIPVADMEPNVEVLKVSAPEDLENWLTIGPIFQGFQQLEEIHITRSNVPAIGKHSFWGVPSLRLLNLTHNNISQVTDNNFRGLSNLLELHLDWNRIESMGSGTFQHLQDLRVLSLKGNKIYQLAPRLFLKLTKLHYLDLSFNNVQHLDPKVFKDIQEIRTFSCRQCNLRNMNPHIYSLLANLEHLDLGENQFKYLDKEEFRDLKKLVSLKLDGNHFPVVLDETFSSQIKLWYLNLARSHIAKVTNYAFQNLTGLLELDLSYNKLDRLEPVTFKPLSPKLTSLSISGNNLRIEEFLSVLKVTPKLKTLEMADLEPKNGFPLGLLTNVMSLKELNISGNGLTKFQYQLLSPISSLSSLDLSRNKLYSLDEATVARMDSIPTVYLDDNPWACDLCHIVPMLRSNTSWMSSAVCTIPQRLRGRTLRSLTPEQLSLCGSGLDYKEDGFAGLALTHKTQLGLIAAGSAVALLVITMAAVIAGLLYNKSHGPCYYSDEQKQKVAQEEIFIDEKKLSIATIDEITKVPELEDAEDTS